VSMNGWNVAVTCYIIGLGSMIMLILRFFCLIMYRALSKTQDYSIKKTVTQCVLSFAFQGFFPEINLCFIWEPYRLRL
jgi:hypothetical protein